MTISVRTVRVCDHPQCDVEEGVVAVIVAVGRRQPRSVDACAEHRQPFEAAMEWLATARPRAQAPQ